MFKYLKIAFRNVIMNKRRSLFIGSAIAIGVIIMIVTASMSDGIRGNMMKNALAFNTGHVNIYGTQYIRGKALSKIQDLNKINNVLKKNILDAEIYYRITLIGKMYNPRKNVASRGVKLVGIDLEKEQRFKESATIIKGSIESILEKKYALIDEETARKFQLNIGDVFSVEGLIDSEEFGIVKSTSDFTVGGITQGTTLGFVANIYLNNKTVKQFYMDEKLEASKITIYIENMYEAETIANNLEDLLNDVGFTVLTRKNSDEESETESNSDAIKMTGEAPKNAEGMGPGPGGGMRKMFGMFEKSDKEGLEIRITTWKEEIAFMEEMLNTVDNISLFLNIVLLAIILVGISNTLVMSIRERTYEIGTIRAIGMQKPSVLLMFMLEGMFLALLGSFIGILIGGTLSFIFSVWGIYIGPSNLSVFLVNNTLYFKLSIELILSVILVILFVSVLASLYPSYKATKLKPVTAMHKD